MAADRHEGQEESVPALAELLLGTVPSEVPTSTFGRLGRSAGVAMRVGRMALSRRTRDAEGLAVAAVDPAMVERLVRSLGELKGIAMKMGQILSYIDDSLPPETRQMLATLQTASQPTAFEDVEATVKALAELSHAVQLDDPRAIRDAIVGLGARDPGPRGAAFETTRGLLRGFFAPVLETGRHRIAAGVAAEVREIARTKMAIMRLRLPGKLLFLFRIRFGLYAVLSRLGAELDWSALEAGLADEALASG